MGVLKTSTGVFAAAVAKHAFEVAKSNKDDPRVWLTATAVASLSSGVSYHAIKPEVMEIIQTVQGKEK